MGLSLSGPLVYDSGRSRWRAVEELVELVRYRDLLWSFALRDLTVRYKRSVLGFLWTMLNPLLMMIVLSVVFSAAFRFPVESYPVYLLSGLLLWNLFSQSTTQAIHNLVWSGSLINKIYVPKGIFVISAIVVGLINLLLALVPLALIMIVTGHPFSPTMLFLPVSILLTLCFALGVGLLVTTWAVFFADIIDIYQVALTALLYLTPVVYPVAVIPPRYLPFVHLNPMYYFVEIFRLPIYSGQIPEGYLLARATLCALGALVVGWWFFTSKVDEFAYRI